MTLVALATRVTHGSPEMQTTVSARLTAATTATVTATSSTAVTTSPRLLFVAGAPNGFWKLVRSGAEKAARDSGASLDFLVMVDGTEEEQKRLVDLAIGRRADGLAIAAVAGPSAEQEVNRAAAQMPVITVGTDVATSKRRCFIGSDQYHAGLEAGRALVGVVARTTGTRAIGITAGRVDDPIVQVRLRGVRDALAGRLSIVGPVYDSGADDKAIGNVEQMLAGAPDLAGMIGISRHNGPVIARVMQDRRMDSAFKVVCFDEELETVAAMSDGRIYASVMEDPFEIGSRAVTLLVDLAKGAAPVIPEKEKILTRVKVLRAGGINEFVRQLTTRSRRIE